MTKVKFVDNSNIHVVTSDGETFFLEAHMPVAKEYHLDLSKKISKSFDKNFSNDKSSMIHWVLMDLLSNAGIGFRSKGSDRSEERLRIGQRIREIRESKNMEAKQLAFLANIDAANLSRIEKGKYSVGFDILTKIADVFGKRIDFV